MKKKINTKRAESLKRVLEASNSAADDITLAIKLLTKEGYTPKEARAIAEFTFGKKKA